VQFGQPDVANCHFVLAFGVAWALLHQVFPGLDDAQLLGDSPADVARPVSTARVFISSSDQSKSLR
jgi:hypothetical protein